MPVAAPAWTCLDCATRYPTRVAWCSYCSSQGRVVLIGQRPSAAIDQEPESADAASLAAIAGEPVPVRAYPTILTGHGALAVLWGVPGGGKSTLAARWLNAVQGPVLYVSHEEGLGPTIAARLKRLGIGRRDIKLLGSANVDQVVAEIRRSRPVAVAIDSVQAGVWEASDLRHLLALHPHLSTILTVCQVNAKGVPERRRGLIHEADLAVHVEAMSATVTKSRYQELTNGTDDMPVLPISATVAGDTVRPYCTCSSCNARVFVRGSQSLVGLAILNPLATTLSEKITTDGATWEVLQTTRRQVEASLRRVSTPEPASSSSTVSGCSRRRKPRGTSHIGCYVNSSGFVPERLGRWIAYPLLLMALRSGERP